MVTSLVTMIFAQTLPVTRYAFDGKFKHSKITESIWVEETADGYLSGEIVYTSSKHKTPIRVFGSVYDLPDGNHQLSLTEYQADGCQSGFLTIKKAPKTGALSGEWRDLGFDDKQRTYAIQLTEVPFPKDKGDTFTYSDDITGNYVYSHPHHTKGEQGGAVEIYNLKGAPGKVSLHISKYDPQLAEYESNVYFDNSWHSDELEECGYRFKVEVFRDFVLVKTTSDPEQSYDCFGAWTTLAGFYLKTESH